MSGKRLYEIYHKNIKLQKRIIERKNFTYRLIIPILEKYTRGKRGLKILDYGCGVGTLDFYLAHKGHKVLGVDVSSRAIKAAEKNAKHLGVANRVKYTSLRKGKEVLKEKKFDLILCLETIEHVRDDRTLIKYLSGFLKKRGFLILSTVSVNAPLHKTKFADNFDKRVGHLRRYKLSNLKKKLRKEGFTIVDEKKDQGVLRDFLFVSNLGRHIVRVANKFKIVSDLISLVDKLTLPLGEAHLFLVARA